MKPRIKGCMGGYAELFEHGVFVRKIYYVCWKCSHPGARRVGVGYSPEAAYRMWQQQFRRSWWEFWKQAPVCRGGEQ